MSPKAYHAAVGNSLAVSSSTLLQELQSSFLQGPADLLAVSSSPPLDSRARAAWLSKILDQALAITRDLEAADGCGVRSSGGPPAAAGR